MPSLVSERHDWIDLGCPPGRDVAGHKSHGSKRNGTAIGSPTAGTITSVINDNRDLQLALRLEF